MDYAENGKDYIQYTNQILDDDGTLYYLDESGNLVKNDTIIIDGVQYKADSVGVLSKVTVTSNQWISSRGAWYYYEDGEPVTDAYRTIDGVEYHFGYDGRMSTGVFEDGDKVLFAEKDGRIVRQDSGWYYSQQSRKWYYFKSKVQLARDERLTIKGKEYSFDWNGVMCTGSFWENGEYVLADASGAIITQNGWQKVNNKWYYINEGTLVCNTVFDIKGASYYFDYDGSMKTGKTEVMGDATHYYVTDATGAIIKNRWVRQDLTWVYAGKDGRLATDEWVGRCYLKEDGMMAVGETAIDGILYVFDENGYLEGTVGSKAGWQKLDGHWYYYTEDGQPYNGWLDQQWYILNGKMQTNCVVPAMNGEESQYSYVGTDGTIQNGWIKLGYGGLRISGWAYSENGKLVETGWRKIGQYWYYFDNTNAVMNCVYKVNDAINQFDANGHWLREVKKAGWIKQGGYWYYINEDLTLNYESEKKIGNLTYYFCEDGRMASNELFWIGENDYIWVNGNGNQDTTDG